MAENDKAEADKAPAKKAATKPAAKKSAKPAETEAAVSRPGVLKVQAASGSRRPHRQDPCGSR